MAQTEMQTAFRAQGPVEVTRGRVSSGKSSHADYLFLAQPWGFLVLLSAWSSLLLVHLPCLALLLPLRPKEGQFIQVQLLVNKTQALGGL